MTNHQQQQHHHQNTTNNNHTQIISQPIAPTNSNKVPKKPEDIEAKPSIVGLNYRVQRKIGEGSFGVIYEGVHVLERQPVAIKFESKKSTAPQLRDEYRTYRILAGSVGIPNAYYFGHESLYYCLVIDLLGSSLEELFNICSRRFTVKTVAMLAKQMISRIQTIHEKNLIYRDIKPDNFLVGRGNKDSSIFIVDFGMAKHYRDPKTKQHIAYRERKSLSGTARYMSINTHLGREQSRRDDLEALGHVFFYFLRGSLPWQGLRAANNKEKYEKIGEKKQTTPIAELCEGLPEEFGEYLRYARSLGFEETPNYDYLRSLMDSVLKKSGEVEDFVFDWISIKKKKESFSIGQGIEAFGPPKAPQIPVLDEDYSHGHGNQFVRTAFGGGNTPHHPARSPNFSDHYHHHHHHHSQEGESSSGAGGGQIHGHRSKKKGFFKRLFCFCFSKGGGAVNHPNDEAA